MKSRERKRPTRETYYMKIAMAVRERANCRGNRVGSIIVLDDRVISTGYNGTPEGVKNCDEGGCYRCREREKFGPGTGYDICICVHAEQNTLLTAARFGISVQGGSLYTTMRPCFGCTKEIIQAKIKKVFYLHDWSYKDDLRDEYEKLQNKIPEIKRVSMKDPDELWAVSTKKVLVPQDTGHINPPSKEIPSA